MAMHTVVVLSPQQVLWSMQFKGYLANAVFGSTPLRLLQRYRLCLGQPAGRSVLGNATVCPVLVTLPEEPPCRMMCWMIMLTSLMAFLQLVRPGIYLTSVMFSETFGTPEFWLKCTCDLNGRRR